MTDAEKTRNRPGRRAGRAKNPGLRQTVIRNALRTAKGPPDREEKMMDENEFRKSYHAEDKILGSGIAPDMEVETRKGKHTLPVRVMAIMMSAYRNGETENPLRSAASGHEITLGIICEDGEMDTVEMLTAEYAGRLSADGDTVSPRAVAELIERLASICGQPGMEGFLYFHQGGTLLARHGADAADAAVLRIQEEIKGMILEHGEESRTTLADIAMRSAEGRRNTA